MCSASVVLTSRSSPPSRVPASLSGCHGGVHADIDELLKKCSQGDAESLDVLNANRERRNSARQRKIYDADFRVIADRAALALPVSFLTCHLSDKIGTGRTGYGGLRYTRAQWPARAMRRCARLSGGIRAYRAMGRVQLGMCRSPSQGD